MAAKVPDGGALSRCPAGLAGAAERRSAKTLTRVIAAIGWLQERGERVSLRRLPAAAAEIDPDAPRLAESTILRNPAAYAAYEAARPPPLRRLRRRPSRADKRLERKSKAELIDRIHELEADKAQLQLCLERSTFGDAEASDPFI